MGGRQGRPALSALILAVAACSAAGDRPRVALDGTLDGLFAWESIHGRVPDGADVVVRGAISPELDERARTWRRWNSLKSGDATDRLPPAPVVPPGAPARVIEFGWDIPDPASLRANIASMERVPFDGVVFDVKLGAKSFAWTTDRLPDDALAAALADLKATRFARFNHNFLRVNAAGIVNAGLAARLVRDAGLRGIFFDTEPYELPTWSTGTDDDARARGREFGRAFREAPEAVILLSFAYSHGQKNFDRLPAFLDGMIESLPSTVEVVDGYENSYGFKTREAFARGRAAIRSASPARVKTGFGLWMDFESGRHSWPARAHFAAPEFSTALREARAASDGWVWVYTERLNWWTGENLPEAYRQALQGR